MRPPDATFPFESTYLRCLRTWNKSLPPDRRPTRHSDFLGPVLLRFPAHGRPSARPSTLQASGVTASENSVTRFLKRAQGPGNVGESAAPQSSSTSATSACRASTATWSKAAKAFCCGASGRSRSATKSFLLSRRAAREEHVHFQVLEQAKPCVVGKSPLDKILV